MSEPTGESRAPLEAALGNRQIPDDAVLRNVTIGEVRRVVAAAQPPSGDAPDLREALDVERLHSALEATTDGFSGMEWVNTRQWAEDIARAYAEDRT